MATYSLTWDLPPTQKLGDYAEKAKTAWIPTILKQPGLKEFRAFRNPINTTPQVMAWHDFDSLESANKFLASKDGVEMLADMREMGCTNFNMQIWDISPIIPEPLKP